MRFPRIWDQPRRSHLVTVGLAAALIGAPVTVTSDPPGFAWQTVLAEKGGNGGDHGGGNGGGHGGGKGGSAGGGKNEAGRGQGEHGRGGDGAARRDAEYRDLDELADRVRSGKAFGHTQADQRVERAKDRYREALDKAHGPHAAEGDRTDAEDGEVAHRFSPEDSRQLIARGWRARQAPADGFKNHGQRVRTMVQLAKRLGYDARVGAMQANFGTPYENGIAELQAQLAEARAAAAANLEDDEAAARVKQLNADLAAAIEAAKPGNGPDDSWATADLDVNDDGVVDSRDLAALDPADPVSKGDNGTAEDGEDQTSSDGDGDGDGDGDETPIS